jgi:hypothetical protein
MEREWRGREGENHSPFANAEEGCKAEYERI